MAKQASTRLVDGVADSLYARDFYAWTRDAASQLRAHRFDRLDADRAAEEIEDMGKRDARELASRMQVVMTHLLKWQFQPGKRSRSWQRTLLTQRERLARLLRQSPSLRAIMRADLAREYAGAVCHAALDTRLAESRFPSRCPYSVDQILDQGFLPE